MDAATGPIATAKSLLRTMLSKCVALQTIDGNSFSEAETFERIYLDALPSPPDNRPEYSREEFEALRPFVLLYMPALTGFGMQANAAGSITAAVAHGSFIVELHRAVPEHEQTDAAAADRSLENILGRLITTGDMANPGLWQLSRASTYLELVNTELLEVYRTHPDDIPSKGDYQIATLLVQWGTNA